MPVQASLQHGAVLPNHRDHVLCRAALRSWRALWQRRRTLRVLANRLLANTRTKALARCMARWQEWVLERRLSIRSIVRLCRRYLVKALSAWRMVVAGRKRLGRLLARAQARLGQRRLLRAVVAWRLQVQAKETEGGKQAADCTVVITRWKAYVQACTYTIQLRLMCISLLILTVTSAYEVTSTSPCRAASVSSRSATTWRSVAPTVSCSVPG